MNYLFIAFIYKLLLILFANWKYEINESFILASSPTYNNISVIYNMWRRKKW